MPQGAASRSCWCANKVDDPPARPTRRRCGRSAWASRYPVSALHGRGSGDLLDAILGQLPPAPEQVFGGIPHGGPRRVALIGRPNVGKSSC